MKGNIWRNNIKLFIGMIIMVFLCLALFIKQEKMSVNACETKAIDSVKGSNYQNSVKKLSIDRLFNTKKISEKQIIASGNWGDCQYLIYDDGTCDITGIGEVGNIDDVNNKKYIKTVMIDVGATSIGDYAFNGCGFLEEVTLPKSLISIGDYAFNGCSFLAEISLPEGLTSIGSFAFNGCYNLEKVRLPESLTSIGVDSFKECEKIKKLTIPCNLNAANIGMDKLEEVNITRGNGKMLSYNNRSDSLNYYGNTPWYMSKNSMRRITLEEGIDKITSYAFYGQNNLTEVIIQDGVTSIDIYAFCQCNNLAKVILPKRVTSIGSYAFCGCSRLAEITLSEGLADIGSYAFKGCSSLAEITLPESLTIIGMDSFKECENIKKLTVSCNLNVQKIGLNKLEEVIITKGTGKMYSYNNRSDSLNYYGNTPWFMSRYSIRKITLEEGIYEVSSYAFYGQNNLTEFAIKLPGSLTNIGDNAFEKCSGLTELTIPDGVETIGNDAFAGCSNIKSLTIPSHIDASIIGTNKLEEVVITKGTGTMYSYNDNYANTPWYKNRYGMKTIKLEEGIKVIGDYAFYKQIIITEMTIPKGTIRIGAYSFASCNSLEKLVVPESVKEIENTAFNSDIGLVLYVYNNSYAHRFAESRQINYVLIEPETKTTTTINITLKKVSKVKLKNKKKRKMIIAWARVANAKKYQVKYATNKKLKKYKLKTCTKTKITLKKLKKKKTYYVRVRAVRGKLFGAWSSTKKIRIRK